MRSPDKISVHSRPVALLEKIVFLLNKVVTRDGYAVAANCTIIPVASTEIRAEEILRLQLQLHPLLLRYISP